MMKPRLLDQVRDAIRRPIIAPAPVREGASLVLLGE